MSGIEEGWQLTTLAAVSQKPQYGANVPGVLDPVGPRYVRQTDISTGYVDWANVPFCSLSDQDASKYELRPGDLLISRLGAGVGTAATVLSDESAAFAGYLVRFRVQTDLADPYFVGYQLHTPGWRDHVNGYRLGAAQPTLNAKQMGEFQFRLPNLNTQRAIAEVLGALDDKIAANRRVQELADELFHSLWLSMYQCLEGQMVHLSEIVTTQYGLTASASKQDVGPKFLRVTDINKQNWIDWSSVPSVPTEETQDGKYRLSPGDLVVARMADPGKSAIFEDTNVDAVFASYLVRLKPPSYEIGLFIYGFLKSHIYEHYSYSATTGSVQKNMNAKVLVDVNLRLPDSQSLAEFLQQAAPLRELIAAKARENQVLASTRDELLPLLMSGRITVGAASSRVEEVV